MWKKLKCQINLFSAAVNPSEPAKPKPAVIQPPPAAPAKTSIAKSQRVSDDIQADRPSVEKKRQRQLAAQQIPPRYYINGREPGNQGNNCKP